MVKKGLLMAFIFMLTACSGAIRMAEEDKTTPTQTQVAKPTQTPNQQ